MKGLYLIINTATNRRYIGRSKHIDKRIDQHFYTLRKGTHHNEVFQDEYDEYGENVYVVKRKRVDSLRERIKLEQYYLDNMPNLYNLCKGSVFGDAITLHPRRDEIIHKRTTAQRRMYKNMSKSERSEVYGCPGEKNGMYGRTHTDKFKQAQSIRMKGNKRAKGAVRSDEQRRHLSEIASQRTGDKNPFYGKSHTEKSKRKMKRTLKLKRETGEIGLPPNTRPVKVNGVKYKSATAAAKSIGCVTATVINRIKSGKFDYHYL